MKRFLLYIPIVIMGLIFLGTTETSAQKKTNKEAVPWTADDIKWEQLQGGPPGVMTVTLWGDQTKEHGGMNKFPAGFKAPLHYHTYATKIVVIKGAYTLNGKQYGTALMSMFRQVWNMKAVVLRILRLSSL